MTPGQQPSPSLRAAEGGGAVSRAAGRVLAHAHRLGFDLVAITPAASPAAVDAYRSWIQQGYHGQMSYLARPDAVAKRADLRLILPGVRTLVTVAANYYTTPPQPAVLDDPSRGIVAAYALGADYHDVLTPRLEQLGNILAAELGHEVSTRAYVDTGPLLERALAAGSGLGFVGKNTNLIHPRLGSWLFLGELLVAGDALPETWRAWPSHEPEARNRCGRCTRCLEACPTGALVAPYVLDAQRCISYLTVELRGPIPRPLRPLLGNRIFGCDVCQQVCPWNKRFARPTSEPAFQPRHELIAPHLLDLIALDAAGFERRFRNSPFKRARRRGLLRNVAVALGNWANPAAISPLRLALRDPEALVRGHAAWALSRIPAGESRRAVEEASLTESDPWVREELHFSLYGNTVV